MKFDLPVYDQWLALAIVFAVSFAFLSLIKRLILRRFRKSFKKTSNKLDDYLVSLAQIWDTKVRVVLSLFIATRTIDVFPQYHWLFNAGMVLIISFYLVLSLQRLISIWFGVFVENKKKEDQNFDPTVLLFLRTLLHLSLWLLVVLIVLQNAGVNITALVGGLGIGGIAIAFAVQNVLGDIFSSFSIYSDQTFSVGDFIGVGEEYGTVTNIGIKSTRIITIQGDELVIPNKTLTDSMVHNYGRTKIYRHSFDLYLDHKVTAKKLHRAKEIIAACLKAHPKVDPEFANMKFMERQGFRFVVAFGVPTIDYNEYLQVVEEVNLMILEEFEKNHINLAATRLAAL